MTDAQQYARLLQLQPYPAVIIATDGEILLANEAATELLATNNLQNQNLLSLIVPEGLSKFKDYLRACSRSSQPLMGTAVIRATTNSQTCYGAVLSSGDQNTNKTLFLRFQNKRQSNVRFLSLQAKLERLNREITRRKEMQAELLKKSTFLQATLSSIAEGVLITDTQGNIDYLNPVAEKLTGWSQEEALGEPAASVFALCDEHDHVFCPLDGTQPGSNVAISGVATHLLSKHGKAVPVELNSAEISVNGVSEGVITVFHDVTVRQRMEAQLRERAARLELLDTRKNQFMTMLAHELRTPLTPISYATQAMRLSPPDAEGSQAPLGVIERQVRHIKRLVNEMLDVSRVANGKLEVEKENLDLIALATTVWDDYQQIFSDAGIHTHLSILAEDAWVNGDRDRLVQILQNLLNNALKFTPQGETIELALSVSETQAIIEVIDTGVGINNEDCADIFEPFTQAAQPLDRELGGLGIGLSLVKGMVSLHGGTASLHSEGRGKGTRVKITLPIIQAPGESQVLPEELHPVLPPCRILIIEDDEDTATAMSLLLQLKGHDVVWASDGLEGVQKATAVPPDLIICDIGLPGLDGFAVARQLRKSELTAQLPMVALSGYGETAFVKKAEQAGFNLHITKPAELADLHNAIALVTSGTTV
ncbi:ATP-binding protein [Alteromonas sp. ASW11-19]|uniref:histidine kinase n=1 Tax=Alteromonas salexigens TaxID=2982530 RepID=A0ABT2VM44_9ALTE|nr:ATP-binding protein [Alteromonas salexigens]MCU7554380.1 ATP-binding protein [Alteromonas salexigens]